MKEYPGSQSAMTLKLNQLARLRTSGGWSAGARANVINLLQQVVAGGGGTTLQNVGTTAIDGITVASGTEERDHLRTWPAVDRDIQHSLIALVILDAIEQGRDVVYDWTVGDYDHFSVRDNGAIVSLTFYNVPPPA